MLTRQAVDQVSFNQNTSPIPDEMLAHRLGMVPLISRTVAEGLRYTRVSASIGCTGRRLIVQDCDCDEGCYYCMVTLQLKVSAEHREFGAPMAVTSDMLEVIPSPNTVSGLQHDRTTPDTVSPNLTRMARHQR